MAASTSSRGAIRYGTGAEIPSIELQRDMPAHEIYGCETRHN